MVFTDTRDTLLDGKYLILGKLGQGAYGEVFLTKHTGLGVFRAIKRIRKSQDIHNTRRREADALKNLRHASLPIIYDIDEDDVYFYIIEEYIEGTALSDYVRERKRLTEQETCSIVKSICTVLGYMQERAGLLHLDIKPDNIIVTNEGIKLVDFGSSCVKAVLPECVMGTAGYAAPELYHSSRPKERCDVYSLGMLMRFMLTGQTLGGLQGYICSENLEFIINKCTSQNPSERYEDAKKLYLALEKSQTLKNKKITANPAVILIAGSAYRIGTTHFAIMLASYLKSMGCRCLLELAAQEDKRVVIPIYGKIRHMSCHGGIYNVDGVEVMPDYKGFAAALNDNERMAYSIIIKEIGSMWEWEDSTLENYIDNADSLVLVTGHTVEELLDYERAVNFLKKTGKKFVSAVNFADGREYMGIRKEHYMENAFRIPYCTAPYSFKMGRNIIEKTIIPEWTKKDDGNRHCRDAKRLWNNALCFVRRQLSVKRDKKTGDGQQSLHGFIEKQNITTGKGYSK